MPPENPTDLPASTPGPFDQSNLSFSPGELLPDPLPADPFPTFLRWFEDAQTRQLQPNPTAMTLATLGPDDRLSARIVLCKGVNAADGSLVFFTNYNSPKGNALIHHPRAAAVFHWDHLDRQVRLEGIVKQVPAAESDAYFASRPWESRIGAWASQQSQPIASRHDLLAQVRSTMARFGIDPSHPPLPGAKLDIPRPPHWGGFRLTASRVELWVSGPGRVHERALWIRDGSAGAAPSWTSTRLQP